jgi:cell division protein FtsB
MRISARACRGNAQASLEEKSMSRITLLFSFLLLILFPCASTLAEENQNDGDRIRKLEQALKDVNDRLDREVGALKEENAGLRQELNALKAAGPPDKLTPAMEEKLAQWFETERARSSLLEIAGEEGSFITSVRLTGGVRERFEYVNNMPGFHTAKTQTNFIDSRVRLGVALEFQDLVNTFIEVQHVGFFGDSSTEFGPNLRNDKKSEVQLYQGYIDFQRFFGTPVRFRFGRQEIVHGTQFLIGNADFDEGLSFDAARFTHVWEDLGLELDVWAARLSDNFKDAIICADKPDDVQFRGDKRDFFGIYNTWTGVHKKVGFIDGVEFYLLYVKDHTDDLFDASSQLTGRSPAFYRPIGMTADFSNDFVGEDRYTVGGRVHGSFIDNSARRLSYNLEAAFQFGHGRANGAFDPHTGEPIPGGGAKTGQIRAAGLESGIEHLWKEAFLSPSLALGYLYASGDNNPNDRKVTTFNPLFQNNHERLGYSDIFFAENIHDFSLTGKVRPFSKLEAGGAFHYFLAAAGNDLGAPRFFAPLTGGLSRDAAMEFDIFMKYQYSKRVKLILDYSHVAPGKMVTKNERSLTGDGDRSGIDRAYFHVQFDF